MEKPICKAEIKAKAGLAVKIIFIVLAVAWVVWLIPIDSEFHEERTSYFGYHTDEYTTYYNLLDFMWSSEDFFLGFDSEWGIGNTIFLGIAVLAGLFVGSKFVSSKKCSLELYDDKIDGNRKKVFSKKALKLPIDKIDNIMVSEGIFDKLFSGKTVSVRSASGIVKFAWVQNADEFVQATLDKIEDYKQTTIKEDNKNLISAVANSAQANAGGSSAEKLKELKELLDSGIISQEDFDAKKKELLDKM